jgi:heme/copper-type cytochrome/quinol oxidase subunit 2
MTDADLKANPFVDVIAYYGEREDALVKTMRGRFELKIETISMATIGIIAAIIVVLVAFLILLFLWRRRKKEEDW